MAQMASAKPARKVAAGGLAGALSVLIIWILDTFVLPTDKQITGEVAAALTTVFTFIVSYLIPPSPDDKVVV